MYFTKYRVRSEKLAVQNSFNYNGQMPLVIIENAQSRG